MLGFYLATSGIESFHAAPWEWTCRLCGHFEQIQCIQNDIVCMERGPSTVTLLVMESVLSQMFEYIAIPSELLFPATV